MRVREDTKEKSDRQVIGRDVYESERREKGEKSQTSRIISEQRLLFISLWVGLRQPDSRTIRHCHGRVYWKCAGVCVGGGLCVWVSVCVGGAVCVCVGGGVVCVGLCECVLTSLSTTTIQTESRLGALLQACG